MYQNKNNLYFNNIKLIGYKFYKLLDFFNIIIKTLLKLI